MSGHRTALRTALPLAVAAVTLSAVLAACGGKSAQPIDVGKVTRATVSEVVEAPATVTARSSATVTSPASGKVARLYVKDGEKVGTNEVLLRIDSPSAESTLADAQEANSAVGSASQQPSTASSAAVTKQIKAADKAANQAFAQAKKANAAIPIPSVRAAADAQLAAAKAQYAAARAAVDRAGKQVAAGAASASGALSSLTRAQRVQTEAAVAAAQNTVDGLTVRAPVSGVVSFDASGASGSGSSSGSSDLSGLVSQLPSSQQGLASSLLGGSSGTASVSGELARGVPVSTGQTLLTVTDTSTLSLSAQVDETDVLLVHAGVPADAELAAVPGATYSATVRAVSPTSTTSARGGVSYVVRLHLGSGRTADGTRAPTPLPGMSAVAKLRVRTAVGAVAVPAAAVFQDGARSSVWIVEDGVAHKRAVRLGAQGEATYQILDGLEVGDSIVVHGADRVREGQRVG